MILADPGSNKSQHNTFAKNFSNKHSGRPTNGRPSTERPGTTRAGQELPDDLERADEMLRLQTYSCPSPISSMSLPYSYLPEIRSESLEAVFRMMLKNGADPSAVHNIRNQLSLTLNNANDKVRAAVEKASRLEQERDALKEKEQQLAVATSGLEAQRSLIIEKEKTIDALREEIQAKDAEFENDMPYISDIALPRSRRRRRR
ncbi:hypothetical protein FDECE_8719 [Fusarium decemcellulare]|nr:hypothetical protein FDECE_8719 [Fusarium decemcellulare]